MKSKKWEIRNGKWEVKNYSLLLIFCLIFLISHFLLPISYFAYAQDDMIKFIDKRHKEIKEKEGTLKREEERLNALRKDVDERIERYTKLLGQLENILRKVEQINDGKIDHLVKAYESMPPEEAAAGLSAINEPMAVKIILKMKPKKAGAVMAYMDKKKVVSITEGMTKFEKKFPTR